MYAVAHVSSRIAALAVNDWLWPEVAVLFEWAGFPAVASVRPDYVRLGAVTVGEPWVCRFTQARGC